MKEQKQEQKQKTNENKLPLRAYIGIVIFFIGIALFLSAFFMLSFSPILPLGGMALMVIGMLIGGYLVLAKMSANMTKNVVKTNKDTFTEIADESAEITKDSITNIAKSVKEGLDETTSNSESENKKYCKHCGSSIDLDSAYCNKCGGKQ